MKAKMKKSNFFISSSLTAMALATATFVLVVWCHFVFGGLYFKGGVIVVTLFGLVVNASALIIARFDGKRPLIYRLVPIAISLASGPAIVAILGHATENLKLMALSLPAIAVLVYICITYGYSHLIRLSGSMIPICVFLTVYWALSVINPFDSFGWEKRTVQQVETLIERPIGNNSVSLTWVANQLNSDRFVAKVVLVFEDNRLRVNTYVIEEGNSLKSYNMFKKSIKTSARIRVREHDHSVARTLYNSLSKNNLWTICKSNANSSKLDSDLWVIEANIEGKLYRIETSEPYNGESSSEIVSSIDLILDYSGVCASKQIVMNR